MVFGDLGEDSGTGVCFTRDPSSGEPQPYGDYLVNAQGEDVVAGTRNTLSLADLEDQRPGVHAELLGVMKTLENHYRDMCDIEFTVENGTLWILQTRVGKRTARAAVRLAVDMANEGLIDRRQAVLRVDPAALEQLQRPTIAENAGVEPLAHGVAASPGAASGEAVFDADRAVERAGQDVAVVLVRHETTPDDIHGMAAAQGILTSRGGKTSHAAVVARGMGKPAVTGAAALNVDEGSSLLTVGAVTINEGEVVTIDGTSGNVYGGVVPLEPASDTPQLEMLLTLGGRIPARWASGPTPTHPPTPPVPVRRAPRGSVWLAPSTCSWASGWPSFSRSSSARTPRCVTPPWNGCASSRPKILKACSKRWTGSP